MNAFLLVMGAKLLNPFLIILAVIGGVVSRAWWHVPLAAAAAVALLSAVVATQVKNFQPNLEALALTGLAALFWAVLGFILRRRLANRAG